MSSIPRFNGRRILLTGATGSIGQATAIQLTQAGAHVVLTARDSVKLAKLAETLPADRVSLAPYDLTQADGIAAWMLGMAEKDGPFAGLAHVAGIYAIKPLRVVNADFCNTILHMNVTTGIMLGKALRQKACHIDGASFVLVSSTASVMRGGGNVAYAASKGAVTAAAKAMAHELLRDKIRVNCVVPAMLDSDMLDSIRNLVPPESLAAMIAEQPLGLGRPDDVAHAILYLLSDQTHWMSGTALQIDGGLSLV
jgi:NAD(P)-dependent dehydrogenase (short-subunit alcohol dehydrogenase family)